MNIQDTAIIKLNAMIDLSNDFDEFKEIFFDQLHEGKDQQAIEILLHLSYYFLTSDGEVFNRVLNCLGGDKANEMREWIHKSKEKYDC